jgi:hypothetical protein
MTRRDSRRRRSAAGGRRGVEAGSRGEPPADHRDGGGSHGRRGRLWKVALQDLAAALGMTIHVGHFPPGMSKGNQIEHRMFCPIPQNWPIGIKVSDEQLAAVNLTPDGFHGDWNCSINPVRRKK